MHNFIYFMPMAFYFIFKININCFGKPGGWIEIEKRLN